MKPTLRIKQSWPVGYGKPMYQAYSSHPHIHAVTALYFSVSGAYYMAKRRNICASRV